MKLIISEKIELAYDIKLRFQVPLVDCLDIIIDTVDYNKWVTIEDLKRKCFAYTKRLVNSKLL